MKPFLRELRPKDTDLQQAYLANLKALESGEYQDQLNLLGELGNQARTLGLLDASETYLRQALDLAKATQNTPSEIVQMIRLGTTLQYQERYSEAQELLYPALEKTKQPEFQAYHDFALQHYGKYLAEQGLYMDAAESFQMALNLRRAKGDPDLIESTENALDLLTELGLVEAGYAVTYLEKLEIEADQRVESN